MPFKKLLVTLCIATMLMFGSVAANADPAGTPSKTTPTTVETVVAAPEFAKAVKHVWQSDDAHLSSITFVSGGMAYLKIFSGIGVGDVHQIWADFEILRTQFTDVKDINLFLNSPGGSAFDGLALADLLVKAQDEWGFTVHVWANGIIASAAVPVFAVCDDRSAAPSTVFMVHEAALWKWPGRESASDIRAQNELMVIIRDRYLAHMVDNSTLTRDQWEDMEGRTTWFDIEKARQFGLLDNKK